MTPTSISTTPTVVPTATVDYDATIDAMQTEEAAAEETAVAENRPTETPQIIGTAEASAWPSDFPLEDPTPDPNNPEVEPEATYYNLVYLPYGCYAETNNPHPSDYGGYRHVQVYGHTICPRRMPVQETYTTLQYDQNYGLWYEYLAQSYGWTYIKKGKAGYISAWAVASGSCKGNRIYRGRSFHYFSVNNQSYVGYTGNQQRFNCWN